MKISKEELKKIITEEVNKAFSSITNEDLSSPDPDRPVTEELLYAELNLIWKKLGKIQRQVKDLWSGKHIRPPGTQVHEDQGLKK